MVSSKFLWLEIIILDAFLPISQIQIQNGTNLKMLHEISRDITVIREFTEMGGMKINTWIMSFVITEVSKTSVGIRDK